MGSGIDQGFNQATTAVQQGATNMYNGAKTSFSMLAQIGREAGSSLYNGMSTSLSMLGNNVRTAATSAYLGAGNSFKQLAQVGRQAGSDLYNGVSTSMRMLATNVKTSATSMYTGARGSFNALRSSGVSAVSGMCSSIKSMWSSMRAVVTAPIVASFSVSGGGIAPKKYATGGIISKAHIGMVGEAGPEAIIPLSGNKRSRGIELWQEAGQRLGVNASSKTTNNTSSKVSNSNISYFQPRQQFTNTETKQDPPRYKQAQPIVNTSNQGNANNIDININMDVKNTDNEAIIQETLARVEKDLRESLENIS